MTKRAGDARRAALGEKAGSKATFVTIMPEMAASQMNLVVPIGDVPEGSFVELVCKDFGFAERNEAMFNYLSVSMSSIPTISNNFRLTKPSLWNN